MTYFLDFDRTLFDNDAYQRYLVTIPNLAPLKDSLMHIFNSGRSQSISGGEDRLALWAQLETMYLDHVFEFDHTRIVACVYPEARAFLEQHGTESVIVTNVLESHEMHKAKVELSGCASLVQEVVYSVGHVPKGEIVLGLTKKYPPPYAFVDDLEVNLDSVRALVPECRVYQSMSGLV